jgi:hypothetical protein
MHSAVRALSHSPTTRPKAPVVASEVSSFCCIRIYRCDQMVSLFSPFQNVAPTTTETPAAPAAEEKPAETTPAAATETTPAKKSRQPFRDVFNFASGKKAAKVRQRLSSSLLLLALSPICL